MTPAFRDAIAIRRLNVMRTRRAVALAKIEAQKPDTDDTCDCGLCVARRAGKGGLAALFKALGAEPPSPEDLTALGDGKAGVH